MYIYLNSYSQEDLTKVFSKDKKVSTLAQNAATIINSHIRGYLTRKRHTAALNALKRWRSNAVSEVLELVNENHKNLMNIKKQVHLMKTKKREDFLRKITLLWRKYTLTMLPARKKQQLEALHLSHKINRRQLKIIFIALYKCSTGPGRYIILLIYIQSFNHIFNLKCFLIYKQSNA